MLIEDSGEDAPPTHVDGSSSLVLVPDEPEKLASQLQEVSIVETGTLSDTTSPEDQNPAAKYLRLDYKFVTEVEAMIIRYRIECVIGGVPYTAHGRSNLAQIFDPGTS